LDLLIYVSCHSPFFSQGNRKPRDDTPDYSKTFQKIAVSVDSPWGKGFPKFLAKDYMKKLKYSHLAFPKGWRERCMIEESS
jgi:hypothetical protein